MSVGWDRLPLLPLRCVLEHLRLQDAISTMSACHNWRTAMLVYEGHKELVTLKAKHTERNLFLARHFRKHVRRLHIHIDCTGEQLDTFFNIVLPEFYDSVKLKEILFIGPSYLQHNHNLPPAKLKRIVIESLVFKNSHYITKFTMLGCVMDVADENDRYNMHKKVEYYSSPLTWSGLPSPADSILSSSNISHMVFCSLQLISVDYDQLSTEAMATLSHLPMFCLLTVTVTNKQRVLKPIDWDRLAPLYPHGVHVSVNIIELPARRFDEVIANVLVEGMSLLSLNVFFCKTLHAGTILHVAKYHKETLRALVWVDSPRNAHTHTRTSTRRIDDSSDVNPFILLCWNCVDLRKLVVHGYWMWQYDVLGFVRLSKTLKHLELSSVYAKQRRFGGDAHVASSSAIRVHSGDAPSRLDQAFVREVRSYLSTSFDWLPTPWPLLHPALTPRASSHDRAQYVLTAGDSMETLRQ